jgi:hypothetical protein
MLHHNGPEKQGRKREKKASDSLYKATATKDRFGASLILTMHVFWLVLPRQDQPSMMR